MNETRTLVIGLGFLLTGCTAGTRESGTTLGGSNDHAVICPVPVVEVPSVDAGADAADDSAPVTDCNAEHYRGYCMDNGLVPTNWGFLKACQWPYKEGVYGQRKYLTDLSLCQETITEFGEPVMCCP